MDNISSEQLAEENMGLVYYLYNRHLPKTDFAATYKEDIIAEGMLGLVKASRAYDPSKNIKFASFASRAILNTMYMYIRQTKKHYYQCTSFDKIIHGEEDDNPLYGIECIEADSNIEKYLEKQEDCWQREFILRVADEVLSKKQHTIFLMDMAGVKQKIIAEALNYSQGYISRLEIQINRILRVECKKRLKKINER